MLLYWFAWRRSLTYDKDVVSYCYLCFVNLCRPPWLISSCVGLNVCSVAYLVLSGHFKGSCVCLWSYTINIYSLPQDASHNTSSLINKYLCNDYAIRKVNFLKKKLLGFELSMIKICQLSTKLGLLSLRFASLFAGDHIPLGGRVQPRVTNDHHLWSFHKGYLWRLP